MDSFKNNPFSPAPRKAKQKAEHYLSEFIRSKPRNAAEVAVALTTLFEQCYEDGKRDKFVEMSTKHSPVEEE